MAAEASTVPVLLRFARSASPPRLGTPLRAMTTLSSPGGGGPLPSAWCDQGVVCERHALLSVRPGGLVCASTPIVHFLSGVSQ